MSAPLVERRHVEAFWRYYREEARALGQARDKPLSSSRIVRAARAARARVDREHGTG